jgi:3-oxoadipate enol-lactonase
MPHASLPLALYYELRGRGPRLLSISGSGANLTMRPSIVEDPALAAFELLSYDHRGLGRSAPGPEGAEMADYANDAVQLLDQLGWESAHVLGVSFGGMVAQHLALRYPARVQRLVLCCTSAGGAGGSSYPLHTLMHLSTAERWQTTLPLFDVRPEQVEKMRKRAPKILAQVVDPGTEAGSRNQLLARAKHDLWEQLPQLRCPTLVCAGRYDGIAPLANSMALAQRIPSARLAIFEGGHSFLLQDRRALPYIARFLIET